VYGDNVNGIPVREEDTRYQYDDPDYQDGIPESLSIDDCEHTPYGVSKLTADLYVQDYADRGEVDAAAFRMSCIYGTRQFGNEDQGWVAHFAISTLRDEPLTIFGDGKQVRDVLYVKDLIRAYDAFLSDPEGKPAVYNVGGGPENTHQLTEFLDILEDETGRRTDISYDEWREGDQKVYVSDISRARNEAQTGNPRWDLRRASVGSSTGGATAELNRRVPDGVLIDQRPDACPSLVDRVARKLHKAYSRAGRPYG